jgi:hypothetical protein
MLRQEEIFGTHPPGAGPLPPAAEREINEIDARISHLQLGNDAAKDDIRNLSYIFEEYVKIVNGASSELDRIIKSSAQNISR